MAQTRAQKAAAAARRAKAANEAATTDNTSAAAPVSAPAVKDNKPVGTKKMVFVASKITRGLYIQLFAPVAQKRRMMGGGMETEVVQMRQPDKWRIKPAVLAPGLTSNYPIVNGWSITKDIPADVWRAYVEQNPNYEPITSGLLQAFDTEADAIAYANEHADMRTGLEPLAQSGDVRIGTSRHSNVGDVDIDDETPRPKNL